ncbi:RNA-guided endonuclease TnpB family protein [Streptomyces sp. NPDC051364]|uniref:RNA-guided endonuclease InsQ/TnpB family protein n=1 Tax=Streptomyces sp. NPDC051364 TaxID=3155799 RepID=UPI003424B0C8
MKRAFKYRFYPTDAQAVELSRTFGCVRKVYNLALSVRTDAWTESRERVGYAETSTLLSGWKKTEELAYLAEVSSVPLQQALRHLQTAFAGFWGKRTKYPRFKSKRKSRASAEYTRSAFRYADGQLTLAKMAEPLDVVWSRPLPAGVEPSTVTVSRDSAGRWSVSLLCEDAPDPMPSTAAAVGIDVGLTALATLSTGEKITNPHHEREDRARLVRAQRAYGRELIAVDRWFPSTLLCSACGAIADKMPLNVREWTCENCGTTHDRDGNAAVNLLAAGLAVAACGAGARPHRESSSRPGRSAAKQETPPARAGIPCPSGRG